MTIVSEFHCVADWVAGHALRQEPISPASAGHLAVVLLDLADRAKLLERMPVASVEYAAASVLHDTNWSDCSG